LRKWYTFTDFAHFIEIYIAICTPDDLELITRQCLQEFKTAFFELRQEFQL